MNKNSLPQKMALKSIRIDEWLFYLLLISFPFVSFFSVEFSAISIQASDFIFLLTALFFLLALLRGKVKLCPSKFYLFLAIYFCANLASTVSSTDFQLSAKKLLGKLLLLCLSVIAFNYAASIGKFRPIAYAWLTGTVLTVLICLIGIIAFYLGFKDRQSNFVLSSYGSLTPGNYPRTGGLMFYPAALCNYLSVSLMILLTTEFKKTIQNIFVLAILITAVFTLTPGLGGLCLSLGLFIWLRLKEKKNRFAFAPLVGAIALALAFFVAAAINLKTFAPSHRARAWVSAFETFKEHPIFGKGIGTEVSNAEYTRPDGVYELLTDAHNTYLSIAGEQGIFGLLAFIALIWFLMKGLFPLHLDKRLIIKTCLALAFIDALLFQSFIGSFEDTRHLWILMGFLAGLKEISDQENIISQDVEPVAC